MDNHAGKDCALPVPALPEPGAERAELSRALPKSTTCLQLSCFLCSVRVRVGVRVMALSLSLTLTLTLTLTLITLTLTLTLNP